MRKTSIRLANIDCVAWYEQIKEELDAARTAIEQRKAEIEQLRKDAERYRWLRNESPNHRRNPNSATMLQGSGIKVTDEYPHVHYLMAMRPIVAGVNLDALIDSQLQTKSGEQRNE